MNNHSLRFLLPLLALSVCLTQLPASAEIAFMEDRTGVPFGYFDNQTSGAEKATRDLEKGKPLYAVTGLVGKKYIDDLEYHGLTPVLRGCLAGLEGSEFWTGYNSQIAKTYSLLAQTSNFH